MDRSAPRTLADRYVLEDRLGSGGAGEVWRATDQLLARTVAIKLLSPDAEAMGDGQARMEREAAAAASIDAPHTVTVYDLGSDGAQIFVVMEHIAGADLAAVLASGPLPTAAAVTAVEGLAHGLAAAHARGVVHRDVKPGNVLLSTEGVPRVVDFGIARLLGDRQTRLTMPGTIVGSIAYLAPEQLSGSEVGPAVDVFAAGVVLLESLTGRRPFGGGAPLEVARRRARTHTDLSALVADLPHDVAEVILTATERDPSRRFPDGAALAGALQDLGAPDGTHILVERVRQVLDRRGSNGHEVAAEQAGPADTPPPRRSAASDPVDAVAPTEVVLGRTPLDHGHVPAREPTAVLEEAEAAPPPQPDREPPDNDRAAQGRSRSTTVAALVGALVVVLFAAIELTTRAGEGPVPETTAAPVDEGDRQQLAITDLGDLDPAGDGEHPEDLPGLLDDDPSTTWTSQRYNSAAFGGLKDGLGLWARLGEGEANRVEIDVATPGVALEVYGVDDVPGPDPQGWGEPIAVFPDARGTVVVELGERQPAVLVLWFTRLAPDGGRFRAELSDMRVLS